MTDPHPGIQPFFLGADHVLSRLQRPALAVGAVGLLLCLIGAVRSPDQFFRSYLVAYLFWSGIALGCFAILMLQHITGGAWGAVIRRVLESASGTLPLIALLFVPLIFGLGHLYEWARPEVVAHDHVLQDKSVYLNVPFFLTRAALYFAIWLVVSRLLNRWSVDQDQAPGPRVARRLELLSRGGLMLYALTISFASVDWAMSLEPHWYSTIYGIMFMGGQAVSAFAFVIPVLAILVDRGPLAAVVSWKQFHDLGNLLLAFVMLWAYFAFSQYLVIWSGNLVEEIPWYVRRQHGGWSSVALVVIIFHFCVPFLLLLSRQVKRRTQTMMALAGALLIIHFVDVYWLIMPAFPQRGTPVHWLDFASAFGIGGVWFAVYIWQLKARPLLPLHDPALLEVHG